MIGQQALWTEQSDPCNLDSIVWPRAAASAEVGVNEPNLCYMTLIYPVY